MRRYKHTRRELKDSLIWSHVMCVYREKIDEKNKSLATALKAKAREYLERAELLKAKMTNQSASEAKMYRWSYKHNRETTKEEQKKVKETKKAEDQKEIGITIDSHYDHIVFTQSSGIKWDDVVGLDQAKGILQESINTLLLCSKYPKLLNDMKFTPYAFILLYGVLIWFVFL